jgi:hypothetical protein
MGVSFVFFPLFVIAGCTRTHTRAAVLPFRQMSIRENIPILRAQDATEVMYGFHSDKGMGMLKHLPRAKEVSLRSETITLKRLVCSRC